MTAPFDQSRPLANLPGIRHGFFGRRGGVSTGLFASLNMSETAGDKPAHVQQNRELAAAELGFPLGNLATLRQTHSIDIVTITDIFDPAERVEADALVSNLPGILLGILTADCTPVLLADPQARVIGAFHAGWKGAIGGIAANTVNAMVALGAEPERIVAAIGPTISLESYEVGPQFAADLLRQHRDAANRISTPPAGREHFDLPGFVFDQLHAVGVGLVDDLKLCTYAEPKRFFSHRYATHRDTTTGRQIALIGLA